MARLATSVFLVLTAVSAASAVYLWRLRCEGFGCTGIGIAWFAWSCTLYGPALIIGSLVNWRARLLGLWSTAAHYSLLGHLLLGVALLAYWGVSTLS